MKKHSLETSIFLAILIILLFAVYGCGTRKTDTQQRDSIHIENSYSQGTKIVLGNTFTFKPFDSLKPMIIDNVVYKNVIITNDKTKIVEKWKNRNITKTVTIEKQKSIDRTDYTFLYLGMFLIVVIAVFLWFKTGNILF